MHRRLCAALCANRGLHRATTALQGTRERGREALDLDMHGRGMGRGRFRRERGVPPQKLRWGPALAMGRPGENLYISCDPIPDGLHKKGPTDSHVSRLEPLHHMKLNC